MNEYSHSFLNDEKQKENAQSNSFFFLYRISQIKKEVSLVYSRDTRLVFSCCCILTIPCHAATKQLLERDDNVNFPKSRQKEEKIALYPASHTIYDDARNSLGIVPVSNTFTVSVQGSKVNLIKRGCNAVCNVFS